ncbi:MAG: DNA-processing protein DprA [Bacteroidetes bacterium]|nr:DNA-processing protein DprA [Bacteroidota bacterium]
MNTPDHVLKYQVALTLVPKVGSILAKNLISYCGSVEEVFKRKKHQLEKIPGIGSERAEAILSRQHFERAEKEVQFIRKHNIKTFFYLDKDYPGRLKNCDDAPVLLYYKGTCDLNKQRMIAIVGTRNATEYGKQITEKFVEDFSHYDAVIVSGLAYGIDLCAHKAALKNHLPTIGVIAHGLDRIYPSVHKPVAEKMINHGGLLTEFPSMTTPDRENFPSRNRVVAGMTDATIVIESATKGGALITADIANSYNRDVFAVPGKVGEEYSAGCHELIRLNRAMLVESAAQVAEILNWNDDAKSAKENKQLKFFHDLKTEEKVLVDLLRQNGKLDIDNITIQSNMTMSKVSSTLLNLEFAGVLRALPGKMFELV